MAARTGKTARKTTASKATTEPTQDPAGAAKPDTGQADAANAQVEATQDAENEQGFRGIEVDPTPNENYTVAGVTSGAPTPETDADAAREAGNHAMAAVLERGQSVQDAKDEQAAE